MQAIADDVSAHEPEYKEVYQELVERNLKEDGEHQQSLDNVEQRWNAIQVGNLPNEETESLSGLRLSLDRK